LSHRKRCLFPLKNQFEFESNVAYTPAYFAVPTEKYHNGTLFPINNTTDYIVFYKIEPKDVQYFRPTRDQFGGHEMITRYTELLGVPSFLLDWSEF
jgi:hypothetical protein